MQLTQSLPLRLLSIPVVVLLLPAGTAAERQKPQPRPEPGDVAAPAAREYTGHDYYRELLELNRSTLSGAYQKVGKRDPRWDEAAVRFLDGMAVYFSNAASGHLLYVPPGALPPREAQEAASRSGRAAVDAGCDDPLVTYCYAVTLSDLGRGDEALPLFLKAFDGLADSQYPPHRVCAAAGRVFRLAHDPREKEKAKAVLTRLRPRIACGTFTDFQRRYYLAYVWDDVAQLPILYRPFFLSALDEQKDADPWVRDVIAGRLHIDRAWLARGGDWAPSVTDGGGKTFFVNLSDARDALTRAHGRAPHLPEAAADMIRVAMGAGKKLGGGTPSQWFERATAAQMDYQPAYEYLFRALLPRWGGGTEQVYALGLASARSDRFDTAVPYQYVRALHWMAWDSDGDWADLLKTPGVYEQLMKVTDGYVKAQAPRGKDAYFLTLQAAAASRSGRALAAGLVLAELGDRADPEAFKTVGADDPTAALAEARAISGPHAEELAAAERDAREGRTAAALVKYRAAARGLAADDPVAAAHVARRVRDLERGVALAKGEWVDLMPPSDLAGWTLRHGRWEVRPDGSLVGSDPDEMTHLFCDTHFGPNFEMAGHFEAATDGKLPFPGGGPAFLSRRAEGLSWILFNEPDDRMQIVLKDAMFSADAAVERANDFVVRVSDGGMTVHLNGKPVAENHPLPPGFLDGLRVGVSGDTGSSVRFTKLKIRKLLKPAGPAGPP